MLPGPVSSSPVKFYNRLSVFVVEGTGVINQKYSRVHVAVEGLVVVDEQVAPRSSQRRQPWRRAKEGGYTVSELESGFQKGTEVPMNFPSR